MELQLVVFREGQPGTLDSRSPAGWGHMTIVLLLISYLSTLSFLIYKRGGRGSLLSWLGRLNSCSSVIFIKEIQKAWHL